MVNYVVLTLASPGESYSQIDSTGPGQEYVITLESTERQVNFILTSTAPEGVTRAGFSLNFEKANPGLKERFNKNSRIE